MPKVIVELSNLKPPYPLYSSPALTADIQEVKTPEEAFAITMAFQKACAIFNSIAVIWNDHIKAKKACLKNVEKEKKIHRYSRLSREHNLSGRLARFPMDQFPEFHQKEEPL